VDVRPSTHNLSCSSAEDFEKTDEVLPGLGDEKAPVPISVSMSAITKLAPIPTRPATPESPASSFRPESSPVCEKGMFVPLIFRFIGT
jgi:hypothetical protein